MNQPWSSLGGISDAIIVAQNSSPPACVLPANLPESVISGQKRVLSSPKEPPFLGEGYLRGPGVALALPFLDSMVPLQTPLRQTGASPCSRLVCIEMVHGNLALYNHSVRKAKRKFPVKVHVGIRLALQGGHK